MKKNKKEKVDFSLNVSAISKYTDQNSGELIRDAVLRGRTLDLITVVPGVKYSQSLNILTSTLSLQAGACGWNESGSSILSQRAVTVCPLKVNEAICLGDLEQYWAGQEMKTDGSFNESMPTSFEQAYSELKRDQISNTIDSIYWMGDTTSGSTANLRLCNGLVKALSTETTVITGATTGITVTNAISVMDVLIGRIPSNVIADENICAFMGYDMYRTINTAIRQANLYHFTPDVGDQFMSIYPGTNVKLVGVPGLNSTGRIIISPTWNLVAGTDLKDDSDQLKIFYSEDNDEVRTRAKFKLGAQVAFPSYVVSFV